MSELLINVQPTTQFVFEPTKLMIRVISTDIVNKKAICYFELKEDLETNPKYISREWVDKGNVELPLDALNNAYNSDGTMNEALVNQLLATFNLQVAQPPVENGDPT